jgi:hypothetical protein
MPETGQIKATSLAMETYSCADNAVSNRIDTMGEAINSGGVAIRLNIIILMLNLSV